MQKFTGNILIKKKELNKFLIVLAIFLIIVALYISITANYVIIRFNELGPLTKNMPVFYNGFRVGKIVKIEPDNDFKHTLVKVNLTQKNLQLPQNTAVYVEKFPSGELYLQFVYPKSPSLRIIQRGDMLEGVAPYSMEQFMLGQNISGVSDVVSMHVIRALNATEIANMEMTNFFKNTSKIVTENRKGINSSVNNAEAMTKSLAQMAENLNQASKKLNNALNEATLKDTTSNIKDSTTNIKVASENVSKATKDFDKTMTKFDDAVVKIHSTAQNLNSISTGLNETLSKRFGGMRVMFGTAVKPQNCCKSTSK